MSLFLNFITPGHKSKVIPFSFTLNKTAYELKCICISTKVIQKLTKMFISKFLGFVTET